MDSMSSSRLLVVDGEEIDDAEGQYGHVEYDVHPDGSMVVHGDRRLVELLTSGKDPEKPWIMPRIESEGRRLHQRKSSDGSVFLYPSEEDRLYYTAGSVMLSGKIIDCSPRGGNAVCLQVGWRDLPWWTGDGWRRPESGAVDPEYQCGSLLLTFPWTVAVIRPTDVEVGMDPEWSKDDLRLRRAPVLAVAPVDLGVDGDVDLASGDRTRYSTISMAARGIALPGDERPRFRDLAGADSCSVLKIYMGDSCMDVVNGYVEFMTTYAGVSRQLAERTVGVTTAKMQ